MNSIARYSPPRIGFLYYVAPGWVEKNQEALFGSAAPSGLGQFTVDTALKWGQPSRWLLTNFPEPVRDAVKRDVRNALEQLLVATLWRVPGYSPSEVAKFLRRAGKLSQAGENLGRLLRGDDATAEMAGVAVQIWQAALLTNDADNLLGFGWFAEVRVLEHQTWEELTMRTLDVTGGRIDWARQVAQRAATPIPTARTLALLNTLVRGLGQSYDRQSVAEIAVEVVSRSDALSDSDEHRRLQTTILERGLH